MNYRRLAAIIPLVLVNGIAVTGQLEFWHSHLPWPLIAVIVFALALESIAVFLALHAHLAALSNDTALRLRLASYGFGIIIGLLNASHYTHDGQITAAAVGIGLMSASSPWLWAIHSRRQSRDELKSKGLIDTHSVRLGLPRWLWWPARTFGVYRLAVWTGQQEPAAAIAQWEASRAVRPEPEPRISLADATTQADAVRVAVRESGESKASAVAAWLAGRGWPGITPAYIRQVRSVDARKAASERRSGIHAITNPDSVRALPGGTV